MSVLYKLGSLTYCGSSFEEDKNQITTNIDLYVTECNKIMAFGMCCHGLVDFTPDVAATIAVDNFNGEAAADETSLWVSHCRLKMMFVCDYLLFEMRSVLHVSFRRCPFSCVLIEINFFFSMPFFFIPFLLKIMLPHRFNLSRSEWAWLAEGCDTNKEILGRS